MQFIGDFSIDAQICDRLVELHRACDRQGLVKAGRMYTRGATTPASIRRRTRSTFRSATSGVLQNEYGVPFTSGAAALRHGTWSAIAICRWRGSG
jgi:hypothetical protein